MVCPYSSRICYNNHRHLNSITTGGYPAFIFLNSQFANNRFYNKNEQLEGECFADDEA